MTQLGFGGPIVDSKWITSPTGQLVEVVDN